MTETRVCPVVLPIEEKWGRRQQDVLDQDERKEQRLDHERAVLLNIVALKFREIRISISSRTSQLETPFDRNDADVHEAVGEDVDDRDLKMNQTFIDYFGFKFLNRFILTCSQLDNLQFCYELFSSHNFFRILNYNKK